MRFREGLGVIKNNENKVGGLGYIVDNFVKSLDVTKVKNIEKTMTREERELIGFAIGMYEYKDSLMGLFNTGLKQARWRKK